MQNAKGLVFFVGFFCAFGSLRAEGIAAATRSAGTEVIQLAERIALGRVAETEVIGMIGAKSGTSLFAAVKILQREGRLPNNSHEWASLRDQVGPLAGDQVVSAFTLLTQKRTTSLAALLSPTSAPVGVSVESLLENLIPRAPELQRYRQSLLDGTSRTVQREADTLARMLSLWSQTPKLCSPAAKAFCEANTVDVVYAWGLAGYARAGAAAEEIFGEGARGFPGETPNYTTDAERVLRGFQFAIAQGSAASDKLKACLWRGMAG